jgi:Holliday junction resolvase
MPKINSRAKGARAERECAKELERLFGCSARRGQQFSGSSDSPDVVTDLPGVHIECKRVEKLSIYKAMEQAIRDSGNNRIPVVLHRQNGKPWLAIVRLDDLPELAVKLYLAAAERNGQKPE